MKSKLAILLTAVVGFSITTVVFAQDAMKAADTTEVANTEMTNTETTGTNTEDMNEATSDSMVPSDAAPAMNAEVPATPAAANTEAPSAPAGY